MRRKIKNPRRMAEGRCLVAPPRLHIGISRRTLPRLFGGCRSRGWASGCGFGMELKGHRLVFPYSREQISSGCIRCQEKNGARSRTRTGTLRN
jgi:hypothetical protein